jgi:putative flippase GtrA
LRTTVFEPHLVHGGPIIAKVISTSIAIVVNWIGNRYWTFRTERSAQSRVAVVREGIEFAVVSLIGAGIALGCLWISHYGLGYTSVLDDNLATNVVGLALGTSFRFEPLWVSWRLRTLGTRMGLCRKNDQRGSRRRVGIPLRRRRRQRPGRCGRCGQSWGPSPVRCSGSCCSSIMGSNRRGYRVWARVGL